MGKGWNRGFQKVHGLVKTLEISKYFFSLEQAVKETGKHKRPSVSSDGLYTWADKYNI